MKMKWTEHLKELEKIQQWDSAVKFMQQIIKENPKEMYAYISMIFLLTNLLVEEDYDKNMEGAYIDLAKKYFHESYAQFSNNPEYLYIVARIIGLAEWMFGLSTGDVEQMLEKALEIEPSNLVYKETYYWKLREKDPKNPELFNYCKIILSENSPIKDQLEPKGAVGEYLIMVKKGWCENVLWYFKNK